MDQFCRAPRRKGTPALRLLCRICFRVRWKRRKPNGSDPLKHGARFWSLIRTAVVRDIGALSAIIVAVVVAWCSSPLDAVAIVRRSAEVNEADWRAAPKYEFLERDRTEEGTRTYRVMMLLGSQYEELTAVNGKPLSAAKQQQEHRKLEDVISDRRAEPAAQRSARVTKYEQDRKRDHLLMQELTRAFNFKLLGEGNLGRNRVYRLQATPRPGYRPPNTETQVLTGMRGKLWIDKNTYQ